MPARYNSKSFHLNVFFFHFLLRQHWCPSWWSGILRACLHTLSITSLPYVYSYFPLFIFDLWPECLSGSAFFTAERQGCCLLPWYVWHRFFLYVLPCNSAATQVYLSLQMSSDRELWKRSAFYGMFNMSSGLQQHFPSRAQEGSPWILTHY